MRENLMSGSVRGVIAASGLRPATSDSFQPLDEIAEPSKRFIKVHLISS